MKRFIMLICCFLVNPLAMAAHPPQTFTTWLITNMQKNHFPGVSIAVIKDYKIEWAQGFGMADKQNSRPVTPDVLFQAASLSKPVTAMAVFKSVQDGKLSLDEDINTLLTSWKLPNNAYTQKTKVTLRELIGHTAGINVDGFVGYPQDKEIPTLLDVLNGSSPANSEPIRVTYPVGKSYNYSGGGYTIIQQALIDTYHQPFPDILQELILSPLDMTESTFQHPVPEKFKNRIAIPYRPDGNPLPNGPYNFAELAAAGLWTTPSDYAKYVISIQKSLNDEPNQILTKKSAEMLAVHPQSSMLMKSKKYRMGLGLVVSLDKYGFAAEKGQYFSHSGQNEGYRNYMIGSVKNGNGVVIMTNMSPPENQPDKGWLFIAAIEKKIAGMNHWE